MIGGQGLVQLEIDDPFVALVDAADIVRAAERALAAAAASPVEVTIVITDDEAVRALNRTYRGVDASTDVLSFSSQEPANADTVTLINPPPELAAMLNAHLGDIVIAYPYAERQAARYGNSVAAELHLLTVHGILHLLGYDHDTPDREATMWAKQDAILRAMGDEGLTRRMYDD